MITTAARPPVEDLGKLSVLAGVREFPVRVKCASLAWHTLKAALDRGRRRVSTDRLDETAAHGAPDATRQHPPPAGSPASRPGGRSGTKTELKPQIVEAISTVFDPEIPVNIYELGLIYDVIVDASGVAGVQMTLTAPGCPAAQAAGGGREQGPGCPASPTRAWTWSGSRPGRRTGCPRRRSCSWGCGEQPRLKTESTCCAYPRKPITR
jgi:hypothetical protein